MFPFRCCFFILLFISSFAYAQSPSAANCLALLKSAENDSVKVEAYKKLITYYVNRNPDSSNYYAHSAMEYARAHHYRIGEGKILAHLALLEESHGRIAIAEKRATTALAIFEEAGYKDGIASITGDLGALAGEKGNYVAATRYLLSALKMQEQQHNYREYMIAAMNLGSLYLQHNDTTQAARYLMLADSISHKIPLTDRTIALYNLIGVMYISRQDIAAARKRFQENLALSDKPGFIDSHIECLSYLGNLYHDTGDEEQSLKYLREGLKLATIHMMPEMQADILLQIASAEITRAPQAALDSMKKSLEIARQMENRSFVLNVYAEMGTLYKSQGDYKNALDVTEKRQKLADSLFSINKSREIAELQSTYQLEKSAERVKELETLNQRNAFQRNVIFFIAAILVLALVTVWVMLRRTRTLNLQLKQQGKDLRELNLLKDKFLSIIAHDLRAPMAKVPTIISIVEDEQTTEDEKHFMLDNLKNHSKASLEMLDKLLYWGQALVKGIKIQAQEVHMKSLIRENIELKKITITEKDIHIADNVPEKLTVLADATHCDFIVRNLLTNAIKFTRHGGLIEINADTTSKPGFTVISVKDNGVGIASDALPHIFNLMHSVAGTADEKGSGIGLMLCKEFAVQNSGDIWVKSIEGKGSTFYFSLPAIA